jgi:hypothetical protein
VLIEFEPGRPLIIDCSLFRELVKGAIERAHGELEVKAAAAARGCRASQRCAAAPQLIPIG